MTTGRINQVAINQIATENKTDQCSLESGIARQPPEHTHSQLSPNAYQLALRHSMARYSAFIRRLIGKSSSPELKTPGVNRTH